MLLRELYESEETVGLIFGRFNPPHKGHKAAWKMLSENDHWYVGTNKSTQGPKDPLPYDVKIKAMEVIWPEVAKHIVPHQSWLTLASEIYEKHGNVELKVYTDEDWVIKTLKQYNGVTGKSHGEYNFKDIVAVPTPRLSSATALRKAVENDDREAFEMAAGVPADTLIDGIPFFDLVAQYLGQHKKETAVENKTPIIQKGIKLRVNFEKLPQGRYLATGTHYTDQGPKRFEFTVPSVEAAMDVFVNKKGVHPSQIKSTVEEGRFTPREAVINKLIEYLQKKVKAEPKISIKEHITKLGKEMKLKDLGITESDLVEAMPPAEGKVNITYNGRPIGTFELPSNPQPHHVKIQLNKIASKMPMPETEKLELARAIAAGKEVEWKGFKFSPAERRPQVMR